VQARLRATFTLTPQAHQRSRLHSVLTRGAPIHYDSNTMTAEFPIIETPQALLKILAPDDAALIAHYHHENQSHLAPWEPQRDAGFYTEEAWRQRLEDAQQAFRAGQAVNFAALDPDSGMLIAICNFSNIIKGVFCACNMGYSIAQPYEGRGLMRQIACAGLDYMFNTVGLHRVMANHMPSNLRSARLLQTLGFKREGYARSYLQIAGKWEDHVLNSLLDSEFYTIPR
jgi:[ribosomal protein S5]-alanine N-acetyltransferase